MGHDGSPDLFATLYRTLSFQSFDRSGLAAVWQLCNEARLAVQRSTLRDVANYLHSLYRNDFVNRGQIVFLTTLVIAMAGCGLLSRLIRRRRSSDKTRSSRFSIRKTSSKSSTKTLTSSSDDDYEDDDYDSNGSLRQGTDPQQKPPEWSTQSQQQSSDGKKFALHRPASNALINLQHSKATQVC